MHKAGLYVLASVVLAIIAAAVPAILRTPSDEQEETRPLGEATGSPASQAILLSPSPEWSPEEVVRYQLASLRENDAGDFGIRKCYQFASPLNRGATGPLPRFVHMIRSPPYEVMLRASDTLVGAAVLQEDRAAVLATIVDSARNIRVFRFILSKQHQAPYEGCWMTDAVREITFVGPAAEAQASMNHSKPDA